MKYIRIFLSTSEEKSTTALLRFKRCFFLEEKHFYLFQLSARGSFGLYYLSISFLIFKYFVISKTIKQRQYLRQKYVHDVSLDVA